MNPFLGAKTSKVCWSLGYGDSGSESVSQRPVRWVRGKEGVDHRLFADNDPSI